MIVASLGLVLHILTTAPAIMKPVTRVLYSIVPQFRNLSTKMSKAINFNTKHLKKGDPLPPFNGTLRIYNMRFCPYAQRTILALNAKQIDYEVVNVDLAEKPEWLTSKSAFAKVPAIEIEDGVTIYESLITVEYLDEVYPQRPLLSKDPLRRANDKMIVEAIGPLSAIFYKSVKNPETINDESWSVFNNALEYFQTQLKNRGTKFISGDQPGYTDYMIWPWFERFITLEKHLPIKIDPQRFNILIEYLEHMKNDPAVSVYIVDTDDVLKFIEGFKQGRPNYDLLMEKE